MITERKDITTLCGNIGIDCLKGRLTFAGHDTVELAKKYGTPLYLIDEDYIRNMCCTYAEAMREAFDSYSMPLFASKSLCFKKIYGIIESEHIGVDVASPGELFTAIKAGFPSENILFHGNNKTDDDIVFAISHNVGCFVCDNKEELTAINKFAKKAGIRQRIMLRITPGIDPHTHAKISTGKVDSKFGAAIETHQAEELTAYALSLKNIDLAGFHCHIGSQIFDIEPFCDAARIMLKYIADIKHSLGYTARYLNLGGGMGVRYTANDPAIDYRANILAIGKIIKDECKRLEIKRPHIFMEPGRSIVAAAGMTLYTVGAIKEIEGFRNYVSIDGGMTDNPRYALYGSAYTVALANKALDEADFNCTIAGRCCESGDLIQENVNIPKPVRGDILAVATTGAYNYSMASNYNRIPRPPIVIVGKDKEYVAVRRESYADLISHDK
ncbi:MAG: diaminopimelate decarboxylase [Eubacteriales bacterium]